MATPSFACQSFGCYSKDSKPTHALFQELQSYLNRFTRAVGFSPLSVDGVLGSSTATALQGVIAAMATSGSAAATMATSLRVANVASSPETIARYANEVLAFLKLAASEARLPAVAAPSTAIAPAVASNLPTTFPGFNPKPARRWPYYVGGAAAGVLVLVGGYFALRSSSSSSIAGQKAIVIGSYVMYQGHKWMVTDTRGYPPKTLDLRRTIVVDARRRHLDEAETRRDVPVHAVS